MTTEKTEALIQQHMTTGVGLPAVDTDHQRVLPFNYANDGSVYASFSIEEGSNQYKTPPDDDIGRHLNHFKATIGPIQSDTEATIRALAADGWKFLVTIRRSWRRSPVAGSIVLVMPGAKPQLLEIRIGHTPKHTTEDEGEKKNDR